MYLQKEENRIKYFIVTIIRPAKQSIKFSSDTTIRLIGINIVTMVNGIISTDLKKNQKVICVENLVKSVE